MKRTVWALLIVAALSVPAAAQDVTPVTVDGSVGAPVNAVWDAWTTNEGLRSWLTPQADIDLRVGGLIRTNYREQERLGDPGTIVYTILAVEPRRVLALQITGPPSNFPFPTIVQKMSTVLYFLAVDDQVSRVRIVSGPFGADEESQRMRAFFETGNAILMDQLQRHFLAKRQQSIR